MEEQNINTNGKIKFPPVYVPAMNNMPVTFAKKEKDEVLVITSFPPRECGIATYSQDLISSITKSFNRSLQPVICALETNEEFFTYPAEVRYTLNVNVPTEYDTMIKNINTDERIKTVLIQHEFGLFEQPGEDRFLKFLSRIEKPVSIVFHTVLPSPNLLMKAYIEEMVKLSDAVIVMTQNSAGVLKEHYTIDDGKINIIAHGTHVVKHDDKRQLKKKYGFTGRKVLTTFGLLGPGKGIETTLHALPAIVKKYPKAMFLILGKTHPGVVKQEGEKYRQSLEALVAEKGLDNHVRFVNQYLSLPDLLEYLQLTDIYLFTSRDPQQAVSGTFAYAMSCACAIVSTPIPHARELIKDNAGLLFDFQNSEQLAEQVKRLLGDNELRRNMSLNALHVISETSWENSALAHVNLFKKLLKGNIKLKYEFPDINLSHIRRMTNDFAMLQFSKINRPDPESGYTLDDNARALITVLACYELTGNKEHTRNIKKYIRLIEYCQQADGKFLNYVDSEKRFSHQNFTENLDDANGRAIWALGYCISKEKLLPATITKRLEQSFLAAVASMPKVHSPRAMAFTIKGVYYYLMVRQNEIAKQLLNTFATELAEKFKHESSHQWQWFEGYLTYANSVLPEALLMASDVMANNTFRQIAITSFDFLLQETFAEEQIRVISNNGWYYKEQIKERYGEQPIEIAYTIMALGNFYRYTHNTEYYQKMQTAFSWFLGNNHLSRTIYNSATGGCFDGLEQHHVNLNQGAESTVCYLLARLAVEKYFRQKEHINTRPMREKLQEDDLRTAS